MVSDTKTKKYTFKNNEYYIVHTDLHASWWTHEDEAVIRNELWNIEPGDQVLDIGCAFGSYTLTALSCGASFVWAWNPLQSEMDIFAQSLDLNGWTDKVELIQDGLYSKDGWLIPHEGSKKASFHDSEVPESFYVNTLDSVYTSKNIDKKKRIWMKMDVESAEVEVLKGSVNFIKEFSPIIVIECHAFAIPDIEAQVDSFMSRFSGYSKVNSIPYHSVHFVKYVRNI